MGLGRFIFTAGDEHPKARPIRVHEYGYAVPFLGQLMFFAGVISVARANPSYFRGLRKEKHIRSTSYLIEGMASRLGEWVAGEKAIWNE